MPDDQDGCPEEAGTVENNGCPDTDEDGVLDKDDACPDQVGELALNGCPDQDGDGIADPQDNCPDEAATTDTGCPIVENTIIEALNEAGINILFPTDGS